jgi:hypothetical protein
MIEGTILLYVQKGPNALRDDGQDLRLKSRAAEPSMASAFDNRDPNPEN